MGSFITLSTTDLYLIIIAVLVVAVGGLFYGAYRIASRYRRFSKPVYESIIQKAEKHADDVIRDAKEKARDIVADAEKRAQHYVDERETRAKEIEQEFEKKLQSFTEASEKSLEESRALFTDTAHELSGQLRTQLEKAANDAVHSVSESVSGVGQQLESDVADLKTSLESMKGEHRRQVAETIDQKLEDARASIDAYRTERMKLVDEEIAVLVEKTTLLTLEHKLTADEHADLVRSALEEAKKDGVLGESKDGDQGSNEHNATS